MDDEKDGYVSLEMNMKTPMKTPKKKTLSVYYDDCKTQLDVQKQTAPTKTINTTIIKQKESATDIPIPTLTKSKKTRAKKTTSVQTKALVNEAPLFQEWKDAIDAVRYRAKKDQAKLSSGQEESSMQLTELFADIDSQIHAMAIENAAQQMDMLTELMGKLEVVNPAYVKSNESQQSVPVSAEIYSVRLNRKLPTQMIQVVANNFSEFCENLKEQTADSVSGDADQVEIIIRDFDQLNSGKSAGHIINTWFDIQSSWETRQLNMRCKGEHAVTVWVTVLPKQ